MTEEEKFCMKLFPELEKTFGLKKLREVSEIGTYIFHEDILVPYIFENKEVDDLVQRLSNYIEYLAASGSTELESLAEVGLLENLVEMNFTETAKVLGPNSRGLLKNLSKRMNFNESFWLQELD